MFIEVLGGAQTQGHFVAVHFREADVQQHDVRRHCLAIFSPSRAVVTLCTP